MPHFSIAVFEPDQFESECVVYYYCTYRFQSDYASESYWIVPGTMEY